MDRRRLGRTSLDITPIGFGAFKIGRNVGIKYDEPYDLPDEESVEQLLNGVLDCGVNYIDTAPAYGTSEERIGSAIGHRHSEFVLSTKVGETFIDGRSAFDFSAAALRESVDRSRRRLRCDVLDLVFLHSDGRDLEILNETDAIETLLDLKARGAVRAVGMSGKTVKGAVASLEWADAIMVEHHQHDQSHEEVIGDAHRRGVGVIVKKPLASGSLDPREAMRFVLSNQSVTSAVVGTLRLKHLLEHVEVAESLRR